MQEVRHLWRHTLENHSKASVEITSLLHFPNAIMKAFPCSFSQQPSLIGGGLFGRKECLVQPRALSLVLASSWLPEFAAVLLASSWGSHPHSLHDGLLLTFLCGHMYLA